MTMGSPSWRRQNLPTHAPAGAKPEDTHPLWKGIKMAVGIALFVVGILAIAAGYQDWMNGGSAKTLVWGLIVAIAGGSLAGFGW